MIHRTSINEYLTKMNEPNVSDIDLALYARKARNELIQNTDWTQLPDNGLTQEKREEWTNYRQALRVLTEQSGFPRSIVWPTVPTKD
jgi:hypothetical protein